MFDGIVFVTSSDHKFREAEAILGVKLERTAVDLVEPQGLDVLEVARQKARSAHERLQRTVLVEDTSLELVALGGFPGPLIRWLLEAAGPAAIARVLDGFESREAVARCVALVWDGVHERVGIGGVRGRIVTQPHGASGFGWDVVFAPEWGGGRTYAEMSAAEKNRRSHRTVAFKALRAALTKGE